MAGQTTTGEAVVSERRQIWSRSGLIWGGLVIALLLLYYPTTVSMVGTWWVSASYQHCMLIPLIIAFLVWERRSLFELTVPKPTMVGVALLLGASFLWILGRLVGVQVVQEFALVFSLQSLILAIFGWTVVKAMIFPIFFMLFLVPTGDFLVQPLQNVTADMTVWFLQLVDIPTYREGVFISTPSGHFHVAEACSGVRYLIAMVPLGLLFANMSFQSFGRRAAVMALAIVVPIIANGIRAFGIIYIAYVSDNKYALGVDHLIYGWIFFALVTLVLIGVGMLFADKPLDMPAADYSWVRDDERKDNAGFERTIALASIAIIGVSAFISLRVDQVPDNIVIPDMRPPVVAAGWRYSGQLQEGEWLPEFVGASNTIAARYVRSADGAEVIFYYAYYAYQRDGAELIQYSNTLTPDGWDWNGDRKEKHGDRMLNQSEVTNRGRSRLVWSWYAVDGTLSVDRVMTKINHLWARLSGRADTGVVVAFSTPITHRPDEAPAILAHFLDNLDQSLPGIAAKN